MKRMRILSAVLAAVMMLSLFAGCAKKDTDEQPQSADVSAGDVTAAPSSAAPTTHPADVSPNSTPEMPNKFAEIKDTDDNGNKLIDEYGRQMYRIVLNAEFGGYETATGLYYCRALEYNFEFSDQSSPEAPGIEALNCVGVMDAEGHVIVPAEYAAVVELNERYIRAYKVEGEMENEEDALLKLSAADGSARYYRGTWYIFDILNGNQVDQVQGSKPYKAVAVGNELTWYDDDGNEYTYLGDVDEDLRFDNDYYTQVGKYIVSLYDEKGCFVKAFGRDNYYPIDSIEDQATGIVYLKAEKEISEEEFVYALMDLKGNIVTDNLSEEPIRLENNEILLKNGQSVHVAGRIQGPTQNNLIRDQETYTGGNG